MLHQVRNRLADGLNGRIEGFVAYTSPEVIVAVHAAALLGAALLGLITAPIAALLCAGVTAHLIAEASGRRSLLRWVLPKSASYNLVVQTGDAGPLGAIVITAPLDSPRWRPDRPKWLKRPIQAVVAAAVGVTTVLTLRALAEPWGRPSLAMYVLSLGVLAASLGLATVARRRVGGPREDASGPAALLELLRRFHKDPPQGLTTVGVFTGCAHAYQNGMAAFLAVRGAQLPPPVLVVALDEPGRGPVGAVVSEGPLFAHHHRPTGPALVERLRWAGAEIPVIDHVSVTDASVATAWGYRALAMVGAGERESTAEDTAHAVDLVEALIRLYAEDVARVPRPQLVAPREDA